MLLPPFEAGAAQVTVVKPGALGTNPVLAVAWTCSGALGTVILVAGGAAAATRAGRARPRINVATSNFMTRDMMVLERFMSVQSFLNWSVRCVSQLSGLRSRPEIA